MSARLTGATPGKKQWDADDIGDLTGRVALVTGANSGIGYETALELARHGAHVILGCRNRSRAESAVDHIMFFAPEASVEILELDVSNLSSVHAAAARVLSEHARLDILVNNAGIMATPHVLSEDGFDIQVATNHVGPFAFTGLLSGLMVETAGSRVVTVSSHMHKIGRCGGVGTRRWPTQGGHIPGRWRVYGDTKLANLLFAYELDRRLRAAGSSTISVAAHPGWARTGLMASAYSVGDLSFLSRMTAAGSRFGQVPETGALPQLYAAVGPEVTGGDFLGPAGPFEMAGHPKKVGSNRRSHRTDLAEAVWEKTMEWTGVEFDITGCGSGPVSVAESRPSSDAPMPGAEEKSPSPG